MKNSDTGLRSDNAAADEANAARQVWCAVIQQALIDATMRVAEIEPRHSTSRRCELQNKARERDEARDWLLGGSRDFAMVCDLAGLDPAAVRERLNGVRTGNCELGVQGEGQRGRSVPPAGAGDGAAHHCPDAG